MATSRGFASHGSDRACRGETRRTRPAQPRRTNSVLFAVPPEPPRYCSLLAVDIQAFNHHQRGEAAQSVLRAAMYALLNQAFEDSGLDWAACHHEDRGDGVLVIAPPGTPTTAFVDPLVDYLRAALRAYNRFCNELSRITLRACVHAGQVSHDDNGVYGHAVTHLFRLLDADHFKRALAHSGSDFALVASDSLYEDVISHGPGLVDADLFEAIDIECKETMARAWLYLPPVRNPFLDAMTSRGRRRRKAAGENTEEDDRRHPAGSRPAASANPPIPFPRPRPETLDGPLMTDVPSAPAELPGRDWPWTRENFAAQAAFLAAVTATMRERIAKTPISMSKQARLRGRVPPTGRIQNA